MAAEFERPGLLFSGGKDSLVLLRLAEKAFRPGRFPFPIMHVDTGHNFPEVLEFRDRLIESLGERLIVASVQDSIDNGRVTEETGPRASRNRLQIVTLLDAIAEHGFDAAFGGARRDEERARAKERIFSFRFPIMHVDTGHNFPEVLEFRDRLIESLGERLIVASVQDSIDNGRVTEETGPRASRNRLQIVTLLDAIAEHGFDAAFGGARRDEERARAKERIFSFRDAHGQWDPRAQRPELWNLYNGAIAPGEHVRVFPISGGGRRDEEKARAKERVYSFRDDFGQWDPKNQRPELWDLYNGKHRKGEHIRVFPLSNWTELDIWQYIKDDDIEIPSIYYAHRREVFRRDGMWLAVSPFITLMEGEEPVEMTVRYRTVGDASCTGAVESPAATVDDVIAEVAASRITERGATRADDRFTEAAMEDRKREGYF